MGLFSWLGKLFGSPVSSQQQTENERRMLEALRALEAEDGEDDEDSLGLNRPSWRPPSVATASAKTQSRQPRKLNFDLGQFAPLSGDQIKKAARGLGSIWRSPWFGRRDLIPPVSDQRTARSEEHTSELQSQSNLVCRLLLEKKKKRKKS